MPVHSDAAGPRLAAMQPYFFPAMPYFHLVHAADIFVFLDDAQFVTKRWTHRNRIRVGDRPHLVTVPLADRSQNRALNEIAPGGDYDRWLEKFGRTMRHAYSLAAEASTTIEEIEGVLEQRPGETLASLAERTVRFAAGRLALGPQWHRSSQLDYDRSGGRAGALISLCRRFGARTYVNMPGGRALYDPEPFAAAGMSLRFIEAPGGGEHLSIIDDLLRTAPETLTQRAGEYALEPARKAA